MTYRQILIYILAFVAGWCIASVQPPWMIEVAEWATAVLIVLLAFSAATVVIARLLKRL